MPDLGTKYECTGCGAKFYDMGRADAICPKCGLNPLTEEIEEIVEEEPAAEQDAPADTPDADEADKDDDEVDADVDVAVDAGAGLDGVEDEDE